ncbi:MAG: hypothetical protein ACFFBD_21715 [Candidatus Hodarchaeota archaeon]
MPIAQYFANKAAFEEKLRTMSAAGYRMYFLKMIVLSAILAALAYTSNFSLDLFVTLGSVTVNGHLIGLLDSGANLLAGPQGAPGAYGFWMGNLQSSAAGMIGSYIAIWVLMELNLGQAFGQIMNLLFISLFTSVATALVSVALMIVVIPVYVLLGSSAAIAGAALTFPAILVPIILIVIVMIYYQ